MPLHNACSYGHYEVTELLVKHGANVNVADLWKFTPLHEAAAKGKYEIVKLLLKHGADPTKKNRDGATALDLVRECDQDVADLLRGNAALLDAAKKGNLARIQRLITSENINCRDVQGRNSTPLHLAGECCGGKWVHELRLCFQRVTTTLKSLSICWSMGRMLMLRIRVG